MRDKHNAKGFATLIVIVIVLLLLTIYSFFRNTAPAPKNNFPGKIIANKVQSYTVNPRNNIIYYLTSRYGTDSYNEIVTLYKIDGEAINQIDEFTIGFGLINADAEMFISEDAMALFVQNINIPDDVKVTGLCRQYTFVNSDVQYKDTYAFDYNPNSDNCEDIFAESNIIISDGPYSDISYNEKIEKFLEFDGSIKYEQYKCPGIDTCDYSTSLTIGQNTFSQYGAYQLSLNAHQIDANNNLIILVNKSLYKIPLK